MSEYFSADTPADLLFRYSGDRHCHGQRTMIIGLWFTSS